MKKSDAALRRAKRSPKLEERDVSALSVRWLAELCNLPSLCNLPHLASAMIAQGEHAATVIAHIGWWSRHPDAGGHFERAVRHLPDMPDAQRVAALSALGYDGLLYYHDGAIIGHFFFQRHDTEMHAFAGWAKEEHRGGQMIATAAMDFLAHAYQSHGVVRARVGTGSHPITDHLLEPLKPVSDTLGWRIRKGGWIDFFAGDPERAGRAPNTGQGLG
jgi:hypothetical protein